MCEPVSIAVGIAVAAKSLDMVNQIQSAKKAGKAIQKQHDAKQREIDQAATGEINDRLRQARREQGRIMVAAGESGLNTESGAVMALLDDASMQATLSNERSMANRESRKVATTAEANALMPTRPTTLGAGLQIGMAGLQAANGAGAFKGSPPSS